MSNHQFQIRLATEDDIPRIVELENFMRRPALSIEEFKRQESERIEGYVYVRYVAEQDSQVIGVAGGGQRNWLKPTTMWIAINVDQNHRRQGVGRALYEVLQPFYHEHQPEFVNTVVVDDHHATLDWGKRLGFHATDHVIDSKLDVTQFDPAPYTELLERLTAEGVRFESFATLRTPENEQRLFDLFEETMKDIPGGEERAGMTLERFCKRFMDDPTSWLEAMIVAIDAEGQWLGFTNIWRLTTNLQEVDLGYTGVRRSARGKGVALALKVKALEVVQKEDIKTITTQNHTKNEAILRINRQMGYVKEEGLISLRKPFASSN